MMSSLKQHPRQLILSAASVVLLALFGIVAFLPERAPAVTEWELVPPPPSVATAQLKRVVGAFNGHLNGYFVWGVGGHTTTDTTGVVVRYDRYNWQPFSFGFGATKARRLHDVTQWLEDRSPANPSSSDVHHVWAVGESQAGAGQGGLWYSQTSSTTGTATVWDTCVQTGSSCDAVSFAGSETAPAELTSIDSLNATTLVAGDANCRVWLSNDAGRTWSQTAGAPNCPSGQGITAIRFGRDFTAGQDSVGNQLRHAYLWAVGEQTNRIWVSSNQGQTWVQHNLNVSARDWTDVAAIRDGTNLRVWAVGQSGAIRFLSCTIATQCLTPGRVFVDGAPGGTLGTGPLTSVTAMIDTTVTTPVTKAWATGGTLGGNDGVLWASQNATAGTNAVWRRQSTNTVNALFGVNVVNPTHGWAVGDGAALSQLSPGNVNGYGWIGSDTCANVCSGDIAACEQGGIICEGGVRRGQPLGWLSLNCANGNVCQTNDFNYGVNLKQKREEVGVETQCSDADQDPDVGALSGFAWVGASDLNQTIGGVSCASDPSVCRPVGWLAFERMAFCDGNPSVPCQSIADCTAYTPNTCNLAGSSPPLPPFEAPNAPSPTFSFRTACAKTITDTVQERYVQALYDYRFGRVEGWARFISSDSIAGGSGWVKLRGPYMCGTAYCTNDRTRTCTDNNDCRPPNTPESGFCDNSVPGAGSFGSCPTLAANNSHYVDCTDCTTHPGADPIDPSDDYLTCSICTHVNTDAWWNTNFTRRKQLTVTLPAGKFVIGQLYTLTYVLDADAYATAPNYDGLRVVYHSASGSVQLDRDIIHLSDGLEEIRFKSYADIDRGGSSNRYYLYYRDPGDPAPGPAPRNLDQVYWLFEDFSINVFAGSNPLWAVAQAAGDPACSYAVVNESGNGKLRSTGATNNCIAYRKTPEFLDIIPGFMEADIRLDNRSPAPQPFPQGSLITVAFSGTVISGAQWWGIDRNAAGTVNQVFTFDNVKGSVASANTSAPVLFGPRAYTLKAYTEALGYNFVNPRRNIIWLDNTVAGQLDPVPLLDQQYDNNPYIVPSSFVGTHTWNANATWDNFKFWYGDVETDYALGAEEGYIPPVGGSVPLQPWACNQCGASGSSGNSQCGVGRCITGSPANVNEVCLNNEQCGGTLPDGSDSCQASGRCSDTGEICWTEGVVAGPGVCAQPATCDGLGELVCNECDACSLYGVSIDLNGGGVYGFGYSNDYGFIDFSHAFLYNRSWLQVLRGSIYSRSSVGSTVSGKAPGLTNPASRGYQCNATFVIRSNGTITNFCSVQDPTETPSNDPTVSPFLNPEFTRLDVPSVESGLQSNVDAIRLSELITDVASGVEGANGTNKFGQTIVNINSFDTFSTVRASYGLDCLGNRVFYRQSGTAFLFDEDWTTSTGHGFNNCVAGGRGSFVFEGSDVQIEQNLGYDAASVSPATIAELAALGIIVIPDRANPSDVTLTVALNVIQTVGNFFVDGTIEVVGEPSRTKTDQQYINDGVMVAQSFEFNRRYEGTIDNPQPSEVIRNDGRLTLNPPPGFQGFASNLPQIREYSP